MHLILNYACNEFIIQENSTFFIYTQIKINL